MEEISNKTLAILLIGAIVISLGGTLISLNRLARIRIPLITGFAPTDDATLALTISSLTEVNWTTASIDWGSGTVAAGYDFCTLDTMQGSLTANCTGFAPANGGGNLVLENIGNKNVSLNITISNNAAGFIGDGATYSAEYYWNFSNAEADSCPATSLELTEGQWYLANTTTIIVCNSTGGGFLANDNSDTLNFDVRILIPSDATPGSKTSTITAGAVEI